MKIAVTSYSFWNMLLSGKITLLECIAKAKEMGFDAIEFADIKPPEGMESMDFARQLKAECAKHDIPISNYATSADLIGCEDLDKEIERLKREVDFAAELGSPCMRHDTGWSAGKYRTFDKALPVIADACRQITEYAATKGVKTMVENHGEFCQDSERVEKLYTAVDHENFGLLADMGNFLCVDEDPCKAIGKVALYTFYCHAKDFHIKEAGTDPGEQFYVTRSGKYIRGAIIGHGDVCIKGCLTALKAAGYDGYVAVEFEGMEDNLEAIRISLDNLKRYISQI